LETVLTGHREAISTYPAPGAALRVSLGHQTVILEASQRKEVRSGTTPRK
jgi:hypothetical protein